MEEIILTPGKDNIPNTEQIPTADPGYLLKDKFLGEFKTDAEKLVARSNLGVPAIEDIYTEEKIVSIFYEKLSEYLNSSDYITLKLISEALKNLVKNDGSTPFTMPQKGVNPVSNLDLATKIYVDKLIKECLKTSDKSYILELIAETLKNYAKYEDVYTKGKVYTKDLSDKLYVKINGTTPFENPLPGCDPVLDNDLTTKRYADSLILKHELNIDPHNITKRINDKLLKYVLKGSVYNKEQTYSLELINSILDKLIPETINKELEVHLDFDDLHNIIEKIKKIGYIKDDGSTVFTAPQKGVKAVDTLDFVILDLLQQLEDTIINKINNIPDPVWKTSGPVESTVGHIEDNTKVPDNMTLLEVCDAIFYGKRIFLDVPESVIIALPYSVTVCIHGSIALVDYAELLCNGEVIYTFSRDDFKNGCITIDVEPLLADAEFTFRVYYTNDIIREETKTVLCCFPVFVGLLPKWEFGNILTMERLIELSNEDSKGTMNRFVSYGRTFKSFTFKYSFKGDGLKHPFVVLPESYPDLDSIVTSSLKFDIEAFDVINMIPMDIPGVKKDITYKMYIYRQALSSLNLDITFNFIPRNELVL